MIGTICESVQWTNRHIIWKNWPFEKIKKLGVIQLFEVCRFRHEVKFCNFFAQFLHKIKLETFQSLTPPLSQIHLTLKTEFQTKTQHSILGKSEDSKFRTATDKLQRKFLPVRLPLINFLPPAKWTVLARHNRRAKPSGRARKRHSLKSTAINFQQLLKVEAKLWCWKLKRHFLLNRIELVTEKNFFAKVNKLIERLEQRLLTTPEIRGSNPVVGNFIFCTVKTKIKNWDCHYYTHYLSCLMPFDRSCSALAEGGKEPYRPTW